MTSVFSNPVFKYVQMEYNQRVKDIMLAVEDSPGTPDEKITIARIMAKEDLYERAIKTLDIQQSSKWFRDGYI